ncbi:hypothetical protein GCM10028808_56970 [Spirosoma migulaei]
MKTILVIEDTPDMRENIVEILQLAPYHVLQAANGKQGIALARQTRPDLILCDIMMPELDGYGVLHIMGNDPALADVPFIFLTAKAELTDFRYGMNLGADDYLTKPFDDHTLLNTVAVRLQKGERGQTEPVQNPVGLENLTSALLQEADTVQSLCDNYPTTQFRQKHRLFTAGSWPTALYFICRGKVKLSKIDPSGNEFITMLFGAGDFVGYLALLEETVYPETGELLEDAEVCTIPKADFLALIYHNQAVANRFIRLLAGNVAAHQDRLLQLAYQSVRKRVAEALLMVQRKYYSLPTNSGQSESRPTDGSETPPWPDHTSGPRVPAGTRQATHSKDANTSPPMTLSRENWSHLVGASTETVIRILSDLRTEGLIDVNGSQITLLNIDKLTQLKR